MSKSLLSYLVKQLSAVLLKPELVWVKLKKLTNLLSSGGIAALKVKIFPNKIDQKYADWIKLYNTLSENDLKLINQHIELLSFKPFFSVVTPVWNTAPEFLRQAVESVTAQIYENWELILIDDGSTSQETLAALKKLSVSDSRIRILTHKTNSGISEATNTGINKSSGQYVVFMDHDDMLAPHALYMLTCCLNDNPRAKLIYTDEDKIDAKGERYCPHFKSDWDPDLLLSQNYICHLACYHAEFLKSLGGLRKVYDGAQDWDLALRAAEKLRDEEIIHIPHVLYHWRSFGDSTALSQEAKPYIFKAQKGAVSAALKRRGIKAAVERDLLSGYLKICWPPPEKRPLVSIIIPTRDNPNLLSQCVGSIFKNTSYDEYEILIVDNGSTHSETLKMLHEFEKNEKIIILRDSRDFNYSVLNNEAAKRASGDLLLFLNDDIEIIQDGWLSTLVAHAVRADVAAVGCKLLYPDGKIQHAGVVTGIGGVAGHPGRGYPGESGGYLGRMRLLRSTSAVSAACLLVARTKFEQVNGFSEDLAVAFNDVDLCLKLRSAGYRNVYIPYVVHYHHESASRGAEDTRDKFNRFEREVVVMKQKWNEGLLTDPYHNPNLGLEHEDWTLAFPPRVEVPWQNVSVSGASDQDACSAVLD
ncbi:MAG: glycosyltransferase family 2 protein [Candidatus Dadabacteria bacterium]|nr:MAG: glycosyltransferase family 2 protein [Candidatus Dadabacteria bacterium]